jgi:hypothetical protein
VLTAATDFLNFISFFTLNFRALLLQKSIAALPDVRWHHIVAEHFWYICLLGLLASVTGG